MSAAPYTRWKSFQREHKHTEHTLCTRHGLHSGDSLKAQCFGVHPSAKFQSCQYSSFTGVLWAVGGAVLSLQETAAREKSQRQTHWLTHQINGGVLLLRKFQPRAWTTLRGTVWTETGAKCCLGQTRLSRKGISRQRQEGWQLPGEAEGSTTSPRAPCASVGFKF